MLRILMLLALLALSLPAVAQMSPNQRWIDKADEHGSLRVIVQLHEPASAYRAHTGDVAHLRTDRMARAQQQVLAAVQSRGRVQLHRRFTHWPGMVLSVDSHALAALFEDPDVAAIQPDRRSRPMLSESIPLIQADQLHALGGQGEGRAIAILDTGVDYNHPFFLDQNGQSRLLAEACFSTNLAQDAASSLCPGGSSKSTSIGSGSHCIGIEECDHGTHVAGIALGATDTLTGVAPRSGLISIQVFTRIDNPDDCDGETPCLLSYDSDQIDAMQHVLALHQADNGIQVAAINKSLGGGEYATHCDTEYPITKFYIDELRKL